MTEPYIVHLETSGDICSVAVSRAGTLLHELQDQTPRSHSRVLTGLIKKLMQTAGIGMNQLSAVSVSSGPGSYTGLRIGVSAAKGLAWGLDMPLIAVPTTVAMVAGVLGSEKEEDKSWDLLCPMIDARRMEVYTALYDRHQKTVQKVEARIISEGTFDEVLEKHKVLFFGSGAAKCSRIIRHPNAGFLEGFQPLAQHQAQIAWEKYIQEDYVDVAYFEPYYLKDFMPTKPRNKLA